MTNLTDTDITNVIRAERAAERERCAKICDDQRGSKANIVAPLTNAAYDEACRDCTDAIRSNN